MKFLSTLLGLFLFSGVAMAKEATAKIKVTGMTCGSCVASVKKALSSTKGVKSAEVDRKSTRLNSSHIQKSRMPSSA